MNWHFEMIHIDNKSGYSGIIFKQIRCGFEIAAIRVFVFFHAEFGITSEHFIQVIFCLKNSSC